MSQKILKINRTLTNNKAFCWYKIDWQIAFVTSIGKGPFTGHNKALVNTLI